MTKPVTVKTEQKLGFMLSRDIAINTAMIKISVQLTSTSNDKYTTDTRAIIPLLRLDHHTPNPASSHLVL
jgi:uncharacterized protein YueI